MENDLQFSKEIKNKNKNQQMCSLSYMVVTIATSNNNKV